jgi:membrane protein implicated in regulation of membrane protease activity
MKPEYRRHAPALLSLVLIIAAIVLGYVFRLDTLAFSIATIAALLIAYALLREVRDRFNG